MSLILFVALALALPNKALTPGVVRPLTTAAVCSTNWAHDPRHVTEAMKRRVATAYGLKRSAIVPHGKGPCCAFDHLVSRELGGADDVRNLWPQRWDDAQQKDVLENRLHRLVCAGTITLAEAQDAIRTDWVAALAKYGHR